MSAPLKPECFVAQPFREPYQGRFDEDIRPAIEAAGLAAYKVDKDPSADRLIEDIEGAIERAAVVLVDITEDNANVWYELGYSQALKKPLVLICCATDRAPTAQFPFDIRHRKVISYSTGKRSDHDALQKDVTERIRALLARAPAAAEGRQPAPQLVAPGPVGAAAPKGVNQGQIAELMQRYRGLPHLRATDTLRHLLSLGDHPNVLTSVLREQEDCVREEIREARARTSPYGYSRSYMGRQCNLVVDLINADEEGSQAVLREFSTRLHERLRSKGQVYAAEFHEQTALLAMELEHAYGAGCLKVLVKLLTGTKAAPGPLTELLVRLTSDPGTPPG